MQELQLFINGQWVKSSGNVFIEVENPATRQIIAKVPAGNKFDVALAVASANKAFPIWKNYTPNERADLLYKVADYLEKNKNEIAETIIEELGAPQKIALDWHVESSISEARYFADMARGFEYETKKNGVTIVREPVGVVADLTPWNFPLDQITIKAFPALAAGNCIVLKPSQQAPLAAYFVAKAIEYAKFPAGVFNLVTGKGAEVGNLLAAHPDVRMVSFTGSTAGGIEVGRIALGTVKKVALELGGKSASVVLDGADYELAVKATLKKCFINSGQICSGLTRFIIPMSIKDAIEELIIKEAANYVTGDPKDGNTDIGPLVNKNAFDKVKKYIEIGLKEGAKMLFGEVPAACDNGYYVKPVIFTDVTNDMTIAKEEIFGPVLSVIYYKTIEEAMDIANDSIYGLSGAVFGKQDEAISFAKKMETGVVHINGAPFTLDAPFGGYKQSGLGRENSIYSFDEYLEIKALLINQ